MDITKVADKTKISESQVASTQSAKTNVVKGNQSEGKKIQGTEASRPSYAENVNWSEDAELANQALTEAKAAAPASQADKIAHLKAAIKNGTYKVDSHKVADRMIQSSLEDDLISRKA